MDQLLNLLTVEKARAMQFRAGCPPILVQEQEHYPLQGPPMTEEDLSRLLRSLANSRQIRDLRAHGTVEFVCTAMGRAPFVVRAWREGEDIMFSVA